MIQLPKENATTWIREHTHNLLPLVGLLMALQAPVTAFLMTAGAPIRLVDLAFGALGLGVTAWSKNINSNSFTQIQVAQAQSAMTILPAKFKQLYEAMQTLHDQVGVALNQVNQASQPEVPSTSTQEVIPPPTT